MANSRLNRLEKAIRPREAARPMLLIVEKHEDLKGNPLDADGRPVPVMVMGRPGPRPEDIGPNTLTIRVVHTPKLKVAAFEPEPPDEELPEAIAELQARLKAKGKGKP